MLFVIALICLFVSLFIGMGGLFDIYQLGSCLDKTMFRISMGLTIIGMVLGGMGLITMFPKEKPISVTHNVSTEDRTCTVTTYDDKEIFDCKIIKKN